MVTQTKTIIKKSLYYGESWVLEIMQISINRNYVTENWISDCYIVDHSQNRIEKGFVLLSYRTPFA